MTRGLMWGIALLLAALALGVVATAGRLDGIDHRLFGGIALTRAHSPGGAIVAAQALTFLGSASVRAFYMLAAIAALLWRRHWSDALVFVVTVALTIFADTALKEVYARARPHLVPWLDAPGNLAYPSGHAANSMVVLLLAALLVGDRRLTVAAVVLALGVGLSRVALGVHWPSDVVGGWMFGAGAALIGASLARRSHRAPRASGAA